MSEGSTARGEGDDIATAATLESGDRERRTPNLTPGTVLDGVYCIRGQLGAGGMGAVYLAEHLRLGRTFAIKVVVPARADDERAVQRLEQEARTASGIDHDHIVDVTHLGRTPDGAVFIVMEALEGHDLRRRLELSVDADGAPAPLPDDSTRRIIEETLDALGAAHRAGVVHRDLKPENLFLDQRRRTDSLKIVDFGISKVRDGPDDVRITQRGQVLGTPLYMAPEQGRASSEVDHRADLYSLGCIAFELCTGRLPFMARSAYECVIAHATDPPPKPRSIRAGLPAPVADWLLKALEKDPADRFQSAEEMLEAWQGAWSDAAPVPAEPPGPRARPGASISRFSPGKLVTAAAALVLLGAVAVALYPLVVPAAPVADPSPRSAPRAPPTPVADPEPAPPHESALQPHPLAEAPPTRSPEPAILRRGLTSRPDGAEVWRDGERVGTTPFALEIPREGEPVIVELRARGHRPAEVTLSAGGPETVEVVLERGRAGASFPILAPR